MSKDTALYEAKLTVLHLLSHRTGKAWADALYLESNNRVLLGVDQVIATFNGGPLKYSKAYLDDISTMNAPSSQEILELAAARYADNPIKEIATIIMRYIAQGVPGLLEQTYALGWNRTQLRGLLNFGRNQDVLDPFPKLGERYPGKLAIWHGGNVPGATSALCLPPESETAVVVLQNSPGLCDVADWICQLLKRFYHLTA